MGKRLRLLNLTLGLVAVLIAAALAKTSVMPAPLPSSSAAPRSSQDPPAVAFIPTARPPLAQFDVLLEKNPFKQPPPTPVRPAMPGPPPPPPRPLPVLMGTILVDDERRAILSDKGKSQLYTIGQEVGGGVISEIKEDRIMLKKGDETIELMLKAAIGSAPPAAEKASAPPPPVSVPPPAPAVFEPVPVEAQPQGASPIDRQERERRRRETLRLREERRLQSEQSKDR